MFAGSLVYHICRLPPPLSGPVARKSKSTIHSDCATLFHGLELEALYTQRCIPVICQYGSSSISGIGRRQDDLIRVLCILELPSYASLIVAYYLRYMSFTCYLPIWNGYLIRRYARHSSVFMTRRRKDPNLPTCPKLELSIMYCADATAITSDRHRGEIIGDWARAPEKRMLMQTWLGSRVDARSNGVANTQRRPVEEPWYWTLSFWPLALFVEEPYAENALDNADRREADDNSNYTIPNFFDYRYSRRRQLNRVSNVQCCESNSVPYCHPICEVHLDSRCHVVRLPVSKQG